MWKTTIVKSSLGNETKLNLTQNPLLKLQMKVTKTTISNTTPPLNPLKFVSQNPTKLSSNPLEFPNSTVIKTPKPQNPRTPNPETLKPQTPPPPPPPKSPIQSISSYDSLMIAAGLLTVGHSIHAYFEYKEANQLKELGYDTRSLILKLGYKLDEMDEMLRRSAKGSDTKSDMMAKKIEDLEALVKTLKKD